MLDTQGCPLYWHLPQGRSQTYLPDSRDLWEVLWYHREYLGGVAHTHPWSGQANPSSTDLTTFSAVEKGLGLYLTWPIVTFSEVAYFGWVGPGKLDYEQVAFMKDPKIRHFILPDVVVDRLRHFSR